MVDQTGTGDSDDAQRERDAVFKPLADAHEDGGDQFDDAPPPAPRRRPQIDVVRARTVLARVLWGLSVLFALVLALAALLIAVDARVENGIVQFVEDFAKVIDLGVFSLDNPIKEFSGTSNAETKTALLNYGLGAVFYLILGRILERVVRP